MSEDGRNRPDDLAAIREAHQAIVILRTLERETSGTLHDGLLSWVLGRYAMDYGRDALLALLDRLERQGLVAKVDGAPEVTIVQLTEKGSRVALGHDRAEGVLRVFPGCLY